MIIIPEGIPQKEDKTDCPSCYKHNFPYALLAGWCIVYFTFWPGILDWFTFTSYQQIVASILVVR